MHSATKNFIEMVLYNLKDMEAAEQEITKEAFRDLLDCAYMVTNCNIKVLGKNPFI